MTSTTTEIARRLAVALDAGAKAKPYVNDENPLGTHNLKQLTNGAGVRTSADLLPQQSKAPTTRGEWLGGDEINKAVRDGLDTRKADRSAQRMAAARARAQRKVEFDEIASKTVSVSSARMTEAWLVVFPLVPIITRIANSKSAWAARFLGSLSDDLAQMALEKTALVLAKSDKDLVMLRVAANELGDVTKRSGRVPGHQEAPSDAERKERKQIAHARKWLMGLVNNRVMGALVDAYTEVNNLRWDNIDVIATVMASISGVGEDPLYLTSKADRAPAMLGSRYQRPGGIDPHALAMAISAAITEHGLDPLVELLLDEDKVRTDGAFKWADHAQEVFLASPGNGAWMWDAVVLATRNHEVPRRGLADAARRHVRNQFLWLPNLIVSVVDAMDVERVGWCDNFAVMASDYDEYRHIYLDPQYLAEERDAPLRPMLTFATVEEAAHALVENLSVLFTGEELVASIVHA